jgi:hypothetical protein
VSITSDNLPDDPAVLKRIIAAMTQDALTAQTEIIRRKFQLARHRRAEFGRSSEKLAREAEQLELARVLVFGEQRVEEAVGLCAANSVKFAISLQLTLHRTRLVVYGATARVTVAPAGTVLPGGGSWKPTK